MSNEIQKLKPVERSLYRRVYMSAIEDRQTPDAAHRDGLKAVKQWNEIGAFNEESTPAPPTIVSGREQDGIDGLWAIQALFMNADVDLDAESQNVISGIKNLLTGEIDVKEFRLRLGLSPSSSG